MSKIIINTPEASGASETVPVETVPVSGDVLSSPVLAPSEAPEIVVPPSYIDDRDFLNACNYYNKLDSDSIEFVYKDSARLSHHLKFHFLNNNDIHVKDGLIYNYSDAPITLATYCPWRSQGVGFFYYARLYVPVYGSEDYYNLIALSGRPYKFEITHESEEFYDLTTSIVSDSFVYEGSNNLFSRFDLSLTFSFIAVIALLFLVFRHR